jgi:hypothetical protein
MLLFWLTPAPSGVSGLRLPIVCSAPSVAACSSCCCCCLFFVRGKRTILLHFFLGRVDCASPERLPRALLDVHKGHGWSLLNTFKPASVTFCFSTDSFADGLPAR